MATLPIDSNVDLLKNELRNFKIHNLSAAPSTTGWSGINYGYTYYNTTDLAMYIWNGTAFINPGSSVATNLALGTTTTTTQPITNSNGTGFTLPAATTSLAGLLTSTDKTKLDGIASGAQVNVSTNLALGTATSTTYPITNSNGTGFTLPIATTSLAGLLSAADKVKVDAAILSTTTDVSAASWVLTETSLATSSTTKVPTQNAVKTYVDNLVLTNGSLVYKGGYDAAANSPALDASIIAGIKKGWTYVATTAGTFFSTPLEVGDMIIAIQDSPTLEAHWTIVNKNIPDVITALLTGYTSGAGTISATDSILSAIQKLNGNAATKATKTAVTFGDGAALTYAITHAQGADVVVQVRYVATNTVVLCETVLTNSTTVTLNFNTAPATNSLRVTIIG